MRGVFLAWLLALFACHPAPCGPGPVAYDPPLDHPDLTDDDHDWLFDPTRITRIDVALDADAVAALSAERLFARPRIEVPADVTIDGQFVEDVEVQLRGGLGSFQRYEQKPQWAFDFNKLVSDRRFHGLEALELNNADEDPSYLADLAGMEVYRVAGSPYARVGYAQLFVNGEDKGLMIVVEPTDDRWLVRTFDTRDGSLYDGSYLTNGWGPYRLDVGEGRDASFDQLEGDALGGSDIAPISAAVEAVRAGVPFSELASVVDVDHLSAMLAAEWFIGNTDGYGSFSNNYRLWIPSAGAAWLAPWDMGSTFPEAGRDEDPWVTPAGNLAELCFADADCAADQQRRRDVLPEAIEADGLPDLLVAARERIRAAAERDPLGVCDPARVADAQDSLLAWFGR